MDQALIDYAVSHGYTREEAIAHFGKKQSSDSPSADWALKQGQQNIADQPASLAKLKEPDVKGAVTQMVPAAANTATSMFQGLDTTSAAIGAGAGAIGYGIYKTLANKMTGGQPAAAPAAPAAPATVAPSPSAPATPATPAPSGIANLQQRFKLVPTDLAPVLSPEELRQQKLKAAGSAAQQEMKVGSTPISAEGATPLVPAAPAPTDTPPIKPVEPPVAPPSIPPSASPTPTPEVAIVNNQTGATPADKAVAIVNAPEAPAAQTATATETPKVAGAVEPLQTGTKKPAYAGEAPATTKFKSSYPNVKSVPQGYAFVPGAQAINTLRNNIGQETFTEHYTKNLYPTDYKEALQQGQDINKSLGRMTRDELKAAGIAPPNVVPGIGAQVGGVKGSRLVKVGGVAGMLVAMSDLAKAQDLPTAALMGADIATDLIPGVSLAKMALTGTGLSADNDSYMAYIRRRQAAKELGAGNRGKAFDPRIPYNPALADIGIPPPYGR